MANRATPSRNTVYLKYLIDALEAGAMDYYAARYSVSRSAVLRGFIRQYIKNDTAFDVGAYREWIKTKYAKHMKDPETRERMLHDLEHNLERILGIKEASK